MGPIPDPSTRCRPAAVAGCLFAILAFLLAGCASTIRGVATDLVAVDALLDRRQEAWNEGDVEAFVAAGHWRSPMLVLLSGDDWCWGYDAVLAWYRDRYEAREMGTLECSEVQVVALGADSMLARGRYRLELSPGETEEGLFSIVLWRTDDGWRIVNEHTSWTE